MNTTAFELQLLALLTGTLLSIVSMLFLKAQVPRGSEAHSALFEHGSVPPYSSITALRAKFLLPWVSAPDFSGCGSFAYWALAFVRFGSYVAILGFAGMIGVGLVNV